MAAVHPTWSTAGSVVQNGSRESGNLLAFPRGVPHPHPPHFRLQWVLTNHPIIAAAGCDPGFPGLFSRPGTITLQKP